MSLIRVRLVKGMDFCSVLKTLTDGCRQCLEIVSDLVPRCCGTKVAWEVVVPSCGIKFDDQKFLQLNDQPGSSFQGNINIGLVNFYSFQGLDCKEEQLDINRYELIRI